MTIRFDRIEYLIVGLALFSAFFYLVFRVLILDSFIWIMIMPMVAGLYILSVPRRYLGFRPIALDWVILIYCLYGAIMAGIGVLVLGASEFLVVKIIIHYYSPMLFYFIARRYSHQSVDRVMNLFKYRQTGFPDHVVTEPP